MSRSFVKASLLATTLGLAALGSTLTPAAALTPMHPGNIRLPSAATAPGASMHPISEKIHLPQVATAAGASRYPVGAKIHVVSGVQTAPGASTYPSGGAKTVPGVQTAPGASVYPGGSAKTVPNVQNVPGISIYPGKNPTPIGVDNICPFNKFKCPPKVPTGPGSAGNPTQGPGTTGPVVVVAPPSVYQAPVPVYQAPVPVYQAPAPIVTATNVPTAPAYQAPRPSVATTGTAPCNCLTKQYLDDGSVLFQDICTKETALATPDQLRAQVPAAAQTVR